MRDDSALKWPVFSDMDVKGTILSVETEHRSDQSFFLSKNADLLESKLLIDVHVSGEAEVQQSICF